MLTRVLFRSLAVLDPRVGHTMDALSPFTSLLCPLQAGVLLFDCVQPFCSRSASRTLPVLRWPIYDHITLLTFVATHGNLIGRLELVAIDLPTGECGRCNMIPCT